MVCEAGWQDLKNCFIWVVYAKLASICGDMEIYNLMKAYARNGSCWNWCAIIGVESMVSHGPDEIIMDYQ